MMQTNVNRNRFFTKMRGYETCLERALHDDNIPIEVYKNLVKTVNDNLEPLHRYTRLRKKILGVDELYGYDLYCSLFPAQDMNIPYEEAVVLVREGLQPLGEDYMTAFNEGLASGWVDVYENEGKRSGAYSAGVYGVHPYVLHNYHGTLNDVFTLAHEMGHAMHSYYTHKVQPFIYANYPIFAAEVASTANEALLMLHLLKKTEDKAKKLYLLDFYLDQIRQTFYRQTLFAEFEMIVHEKAEAGETLTADLMDQIYGDLFQKYYGPDLVMDDNKAVEWSRIPHFYRNFYVYTYATGISAGTAFAKKMLKDGDSARDKYVHVFLSGGSSKYVIDLLKDAGVDMASPEPVLATIEFFDELLDELEALLES
jgi:oligoendopeptidase F